MKMLLFVILGMTFLATIASAEDQATLSKEYLQLKINLKSAKLDLRGMKESVKRDKDQVAALASQTGPNPQRDENLKAAQDAYAKDDAQEKVLQAKVDSLQDRLAEVIETLQVSPS